jgi:large subunit ribosomal protein L23
MANIHYIRRPLVTEKGSLMAQDRQYLFLVENGANKPEIKKAVEKEYKVRVMGVNIVNAKAKHRRRGRISYVKSGYKKAIVTLRKGEKLDIIPQ